MNRVTNADRNAKRIPLLLAMLWELAVCSLAAIASHDLLLRAGWQRATKANIPGHQICASEQTTSIRIYSLETIDSHGVYKQVSVGPQQVWWAPRWYRNQIHVERSVCAWDLLMSAPPRRHDVSLACCCMQSERLKPLFYEYVEGLWNERLWRIGKSARNIDSEHVHWCALVHWVV